MSAEFGAQGPVGCSVDVCSWMNVYNQLLEGFKEEVVASGGVLDEVTIKEVKQKASREFMIGWYVPDVKSIAREWSQAEVVESDVVYVKSEFGYQIQRKDTGEVVGDAETMFVEKRQKLGTEDAGESWTLRKAFAEIEKSGEVYFPVHNQMEGKDVVRYVAHWVKEGEVIKPEMLRIARDGGDKTLSEVHKMLANTLGVDGYKEVRESERAFVYVKPQEPRSEVAKNLVFNSETIQVQEAGISGERVVNITNFKSESDRGREMIYKLKNDDGKEGIHEKSATQEFIEGMTVIRRVERNGEKKGNIQETKVAVGVVPVLLRSLREKPEKPLMAIDKSVRRQQEKLRKIKRRKAVSGKTEINLLNKKNKDNFILRNLVKSDKAIFVRSKGEREKVNLLVRNLARRNKRRQVGLTEAGGGRKLKRKKLLIQENEFKKIRVRIRGYTQVEEQKKGVEVKQGNEWRRKKKSEKRRLSKLTNERNSSKDIKERKRKKVIKPEGIIFRRKKTKERFAREVNKKKKLMIEDNQSLAVDSDKSEKSDGEMRVGARQMKRLEYVVRRLLYRHQKDSRVIDRFITPEIKHIKINLKVIREPRRQGKEREFVIKKEKRQRSNEAATGLGLSWAIWLLIRKQQVRETSSTGERLSLKSTVQEKAKIRVLHSWLILAIIYYLAMVREQGIKQVNSLWLASPAGRQVVRSNKVKYNKNRRRGRNVNLRDRELPRTGVIFSAYS